MQKLKTLVLFFLPVPLVGCLSLGNSSSVTERETAKSQQNLDSKTGYYRLQTQTLEICALLKNESDLRCNELDISLIPESIRSALPDPSGVVFDEVNPQIGYVFNPDESESAIPMIFNHENESFSFFSESDAIPLIEAETCTSQMALNIEGKYKIFTTPIPYQDKSIIGKLQMSLTSMELIEGSCDEDLQLLEDCYSNQTLCQEETEEENEILQQAIVSWLQPYITANLFEASQISDIKALALRVRY